MDLLKDTARKVLSMLHLDLTRNLKYDRLTRKIIRRVLRPGSLGIDVGCHKGEILDIFLKYSPAARHYAFEPIPHLYKNLEENYGHKCRVYPYALAEEEGTATFQHVKNAPAYSGLKKREYAVNMPEIEQITVKVAALDSLIDPAESISLIKIDVEGAELGVLKGARSLLVSQKPVVIFECGLGATDHYGTLPGEVYDLLLEAGLKISSLEGFLDNSRSYTREQFCEVYYGKEDYYFVAHQF
jgi:FkbM family methyltransferase